MKYTNLHNKSQIQKHSSQSSGFILTTSIKAGNAECDFRCLERCERSGLTRQSCVDECCTILNN